MLRASVSFRMVALCVLTVSVFSAADSPEMNFQLPPRPEVAETTRDEVLLRYRLKPQSSFGLSMKVNMRIEMDMNGQKIPVPMTMEMYGNVQVDSVDSDGVFSVVVKFTRMKMEVTGPGSASYDSEGDQKDTPPQFQPLNACIDVPVTAKVTPLGEVLEMDDHVLVDALSRMEDAAMMTQIQDMFKKSMESSFVQLSEAPVKEGVEYDAGDLSMPLPEVGELHQKIGYKILWVSGDRKQVLLQPRIEMALKPSPGSSMTAELSRPCKTDGWLLFDTEEGNVVRSALVMGYGITLSQAAMQVSVNTDMLMEYEISTDTAN